MKFRKKKESGSYPDSDQKKSGDSILQSRLDYFGSVNVTWKKLIDGFRFAVQSAGKERWLALPGNEQDAVINRDIIREKAVNKYKTTYDAMQVHGSGWFPRLRSVKVAKVDDDTASLSSTDSDLVRDGFAGTFSWETRSLQEMQFPSSPEMIQREMALNKKKKSKKKRKGSEQDEEGNEDHRTFETIEQIRTRLTANYMEAKQQREKYLGQNTDNDNEEVRKAKSIKGNKKVKTYFKEIDANERRVGKKLSLGMPSQSSSVKADRSSESSSSGYMSAEKRNTLSPSSPSSSDFSSELAEAISRYSSRNSILAEDPIEIDISTHPDKIVEEHEPLPSPSNTFFIEGSKETTVVKTYSDKKKRSSSGEKKRRSSSNVSVKVEKSPPASEIPVFADVHMKDVSKSRETSTDKHTNESKSKNTVRIERTHSYNRKDSVETYDRSNSVKARVEVFSKTEDVMPVKPRSLNTTQEEDEFPSMDLSMDFGLSLDSPSGKDEGLGNIMDMLSNW